MSIYLLFTLLVFLSSLGCSSFLCRQPSFRTPYLSMPWLHWSLLWDFGAADCQKSCANTKGCVVSPVTTAVTDNLHLRMEMVPCICAFSLCLQEVDVGPFQSIFHPGTNSEWSCSAFFTFVQISTFHNLRFVSGLWRTSVCVLGLLQMCSWRCLPFSCAPWEPAVCQAFLFPCLVSTVFKCIWWMGRPWGCHILIVRLAMSLHELEAFWASFDSLPRLSHRKGCWEYGGGLGTWGICL